MPRAHWLGDSLALLDYELRAVAAWDSGQPVLATDVDFTLKLMQCPGLPNENSRAQFGFIRQVRIDPANPRRFSLLCRSQGQEILTTSGDFSVLPEASLDPGHTLRSFSLATLQDWPAGRPPAPAVAALVRRYQQANAARHPNNIPGCGAYRLAAWETNRQLRFQRKKQWWGDKVQPTPFVLQAHPRELVYSILPDDAAAALALRRHELDIYPQVPARIFRQLQASATAQQDFVFYTTPSYDILSVGFNTQRPALRDKRTRQALSRLLDPAGLMAATQLGQGSRTVGLLAPGSPFYNDSLPLPTYAPAQAGALLRQAGWQRGADGQWRQPGGAPLALTVRYRAEETTFATVGLQLRAAAAQLGIAITLLPSENSVVTTCLESGDFDLYIRLVKGTPFGVNFAPILHTDAIGTGNFPRFGRADTDRLLTAISTEGNLGRKRRLLRRFQVMLRDEMPIMPLFFLPYRLAASRRLQHVVASGIKPGYAAMALSWPTTPPAPAGRP
ncbi:ABC transporter substrate-binding protein [Hymenobacter cheonanensis]|uniref:ABC transporter substrate-binding protein n=1 Tax=Hymenobacter sp. CA2-7 TaxID=3063993 RepID=UPI00271304BB|nr:ABC transporter substrate-binding protein [Hymenobacter sp. CA2-7]MDO7885208.1 ABC transporter substrate-binding protein [Hymenobacter sp. CA2-7]